MDERNRERVDGLGAVTARVFPFFRKNADVRKLGMQALTSGSRLAGRLRRPLASSPEPYRVVASSQEWAATQPDSVFTPVLQPERVANRHPKSVAGIVEWEFGAIADVELPQPFVLDLPHGHAVGEHGVIVTADGALLRDVSLPIGGLRAHIWGGHGFEGSVAGEETLPFDWRVPPRRVRGTVAVLSAYVGRGYFHWVFDVLPRLRLLREAGWDVDDFDAFIVPAYFARFQVETLTALGIPRRKIISSLVNRHVVADRLVVPSLVRPEALVPLWACEFLRDAFPPVEPEGLSVGRRIFIVRRVTDHGFLADEDSMVGVLGRYGFTPLATEDLTFSEKAWVMSRAEAIISPEGAGLANTVWAEPGTKVMQLRVRALGAMDESALADRLGFDYYDVFGDSYERDPGEPTARLGPVRPDHVVETLRMAGLA